MERKRYCWIVGCLLIVVLLVLTAGYAQTPKTGVHEVTNPIHFSGGTHEKTAWTGAGFDFNDRTKQEWCVYGPRTEHDEFLCYPVLGTITWVPCTNYPTAQGADPFEDTNGSVKVCTFSSSADDDADYESWNFFFISPNLEDSFEWQHAEGYSVKVMNYFEDVGEIEDTLKIYVNLHVTVYDQDDGEERWFARDNVPVTTVSQSIEPGWVHIDFDFSAVFAEVPNHDIRDVYIRISGFPGDEMEGAFYIDEVQPIGNFPILLVLWPYSIAQMAWGSSEDSEFKIGNAGQLPLIYQVKSAPSQNSQQSIVNNNPSSPSNGDMDVMITGWGNLDPYPALGDMVTHIESLGYTVATSNTFPASLDGYEILILVGGGSADEDIPENVVDEFVNAGNGLIIFERVVDSGDFDFSAMSNPVQSIASGSVYRTGCTVVAPDHPLCLGLSTNCTLSGYSIGPVMKELPEVVMRWNDDTVFAAAYHLGTGKVVYINDLQAWYANSGYWHNDPTNGMLLMENALEWVLPNEMHPVAWLSFDPTTGQLAQGQEDEITMTVSANALPGTYTADVVILSNDTEHETTRIPFTMKVTDSTIPDLSVDPISLDFGNTTDVLNIDISNEGGGSLDWSIEALGGKPWLVGVTPMSGPNYATVEVTVDRNYLGLSSDTETLSISSEGGNQDISIQIQKQDNTLPSEWSYTAYTGYGASVILKQEADPNIGGTPLTNDHYIGVFTPGGQCCGWAQRSDTTTGIAVWGDDPQTPEVEGFQDGEILAYQVYSMSQQTTYTDVEVAYLASNGNFENGAYMVLSEFDVTDTPVKQEGYLANMDFSLEPNYPNPFNPETTIYFSLPKRSHVTLNIYNINGELVEVLLDEKRNEGRHEIQWNARNLAAGIYFCRLETEGFIKTRKMVLQK